MQNTISGVVEYEQEHARTTARLEYNDLTPSDTYTVDRDNVSIRFDGHVPAHPDRVVWDDSDRVGEHTLLTTLFGEEFTDAMMRAKTDGIVVVRFCLSPVERYALADMQLRSPSTPTILKKSVARMLGKSSIPTA